jgi:hypothetical protein
MKSIKYILFCVITASLSISHISGQTNGTRLDSVPVLKQKMSRNIYQFNDCAIREIQYSMKQPKEAKFIDASHILGDIGGSLMTVLTSVNFASSRDLTWEVGGSIKCNDALPDWDINLFCEGHLEKDRERVKNDDGSWSVETQSTRDLYWEKNATGVIIENNDTIGRFLIIMNPWTNPLLKQWSESISSEPEAQIKTASNNKYYKKYISYTDISYGIKGVFRKNEFAIISNGTARKAWFYYDNNLSCIFRPDIDDANISNRDRVQPYLLINEDIPQSERRDYFRLAILSRYLSRTLKL